MKKRWMTALLALVLTCSLVGFAGCGGGDDGPQDTADVKVVKVWLHKSEAEPEGRVYRTLAEMFNEKKLTTRDGRTIVMVTHNEEQASKTDRVVHFLDGRQII